MNQEEQSIFQHIENTSMQNIYACNIFLQAQNALQQKDFILAYKLMNIYRNSILYNDLKTVDNRTNKNPKASVIVVAYNTQEDLITCLQSVMDGNEKDIEIIVVDNGKNDSVVPILLKMDILYIKTPINLILSEGRNIGVHFATAPICIFLDDDAIAPPNFVEKILDVLLDTNLSAIRGKILPKTTTAFQIAEPCYDLGDIPIPSVINTEGNSAWRTNIYKEFDGMDPLLFGHEGTELSYRIHQKYSKDATFYFPTIYIYHDSAHDEQKSVIKEARHQLMRKYLNWKKEQKVKIAQTIKQNTLVNLEQRYKKASQWRKVLSLCLLDPKRLKTNIYNKYIENTKRNSLEK
ncbi:glycosyltransferase family 2 protein [Desulfovibrio litoralis]|uniref:Glycosyltransferase, GT2 family n=1 Tax=Desulfovibrio litoralis DSM 11393 TaxID=1121455 RepID=A0A1M7RRY1_9BACT|nr:glycosyltransferase [Desulfovibrio litoralis]SHN49077.1 Glycosyltransferase, GT2 family [Desulfovibrio litoralis DSM 11393]